MVCEIRFFMIIAAVLMFSSWSNWKGNWIFFFKKIKYRYFCHQKWFLFVYKSKNKSCLLNYFGIIFVIENGAWFSLFVFTFFSFENQTNNLISHLKNVLSFLFFFLYYFMFSANFRWALKNEAALHIICYNKRNDRDLFV